MWDNFDQDDTGRGRESDERDSNSNKYTVTFLPATFDKAKYLSAAAAFASFTALGAAMV